MADLHYNAFISYRHTPRDIEVAKRIQTSLERFRVPKAIKEKYHFEKFERLFRDQEELVINPDLAKEIEEALNASDYLIVICSPSYMESKWCLLEIDTFLKNHDRDHILCVLSAGEPPAIFPDALCHYTKTSIVDGREVSEEVHCEPLACDYRQDFRQADRIELPRLASAMIGCGYDELMLRQERYRRKRMLRLFGIIFSLTAIALVYLLWSNNQISRNYRQAQIGESRVLAKEALDYLEERDRLMSIETALKALPVEDDRPLIDEAQFALAKATYAYTAPFNFYESWRIDRVNDISDSFISNDKKYLVYLEGDGLIHTIDLASRKELTSFYLADNAKPRQIQEGKSQQLIAYQDGSVLAFDYLSGNRLWSQELVYQAMGLLRVSNKRNYIAAGDSYAVQVMDMDGVPVASLPLPADLEGYIADFCWSNDDTKLAAVIRKSQGTSYLGVFDFVNGGFTVLSGEYNQIVDFEFKDDDTLYCLATDSLLTTYFTDSEEDYYHSSYSLLAFRNNEKLFETELNNSGIIDEVKILERSEDEIIVVLGDGVYLFGKDGQLRKDYRFSSSISAILQQQEEYLDLLCRNGYRGALWLYSGDTYLKKSFPENIDDLQMSDENNVEQSRYIFRKGGDLYVYESLYDENITFFDGQDFYYPPDEFIVEGDRLLMKTYGLVYFVDLKEKKIGKILAYPDGDYFHLLDIAADHAFVLRVGEDGNSFLQEYDFEGNFIKESDLRLLDEYYSQGFLISPLSRPESIYLDNYYAADSSLLVHDHKLYMHDNKDVNKLRIYDLLTSEERPIDIDLGKYSLLTMKYYFYPSPLCISSDGKKIYTVAYDPETTYDRKGVIIDLESGEAKLLEHSPGEEFCADFSGGKLFYSGNDAIIACDQEGNFLYQIPYTGQKAARMKYHEGILYAIFQQGKLLMYREDRLIREVALSGEDLIHFDPKEFRIAFNKDQVLIFEEECLDIINIDSDSSFPAAEIPANVLTYLPISDEYLLYSYDPAKINGYNHLATYALYPPAELIQRGQKQLEEYRP